MSKRSTSGLTASRQKRVRPSRAKRRPSSKARVDRLDALDGLRQHCDSLTTFGGLLEACGHHPCGEPLEREMIGHTGSLILREVEQAEALLDVLEAAR